MENASKALLMAAGILIGVLILTLMVTLFISSRRISDSYSERKQSEAIQQFNVNFTKYLGQDLTIYDIVTICNFAEKDNNKVQGVTVTGIDDNEDNIKIVVEVLNQYYQNEYKEKNVKLNIIYKIKEIQYDETSGYVKAISIGNKKLKVIEYDTNGQPLEPKYETI